MLELQVSGIFFLKKPSPNKIHDAVTTGASKRTFFNYIHAIAQQLPAVFRQILASLQKDPKIAMRPEGILHRIGGVGLAWGAYFRSASRQSFSH